MGKAQVSIYFKRAELVTWDFHNGSQRGLKFDCVLLNIINIIQAHTALHFTATINYELTVPNSGLSYVPTEAEGMVFNINQNRVHERKIHPKCYLLTSVELHQRSICP